ncbi:hypothetical protein U3A55_03070 [Salarchaeum sp. III]|uniref:hypothetical protein n=1 Tax=Salarchaeum sp. III TaxID=3107927 RepID=UPI002ED92B3B
MWRAALVYLGFVLTPLPGLLALRLLFRSGVVTDGTAERDVWFADEPQTFHASRSRFYKVLTWAAFFGGWFLTLVLYVFLVDTLFADPPV